MSSIKACLGLYLSVLVVYSSNIPGHKKPLGHHRPPEDPIHHLNYFPEPLEFYEEFVIHSKAVIFKDVCKDFPATKRWTDDFLRDVYGNVEVSVDEVKVENRSIPSQMMKLEHFLEIYNGTNSYLIDTLPKEMQKDFWMPRSLRCGGFAQRLQDFVMWFNSGKSKSHLHMDTVENINCMVSGSKNWFLVDKENTERIVMDHEEGDYCSVDVDSVDMDKFPFLSNIPWRNVTVEQGDCIYIPYGWGHQVSSFNRNIAINIWWTVMESFDETECHGLEGDQDLRNFKFNPGEQYRFQLLQVLEKRKGPLEFRYIHSKVISEHTGKALISEEDFKKLDRNNDDVVDKEEIKAISLEELENIFDGEAPGTVNIKGKWIGMYRDKHANIQSHDEL